VRSSGWSAGRAAGFARDARVATVFHLRSAAVARMWHKGKVERALRIHFEHTRDRGTAAVMLFGGMGYRPPYPRNADEAADAIVTQEAEHLSTAELYVVAPHMCDVIVAAAQSLQPDDFKLFDESDLPSPTGLVVLPHGPDPF
jgi:hypothetical protein